MNVEKFTKADVKKGISKIRRRVDVVNDNDITIAMIAKVVGCTREYLYNSKYSDIITPFKKSKIIKNKLAIEDGYVITSENKKIKYGSIEYYKYRNGLQNDEIEECKTKLDKAIESQLEKIRIKEEIAKMESRHLNEIDRYEDIIKNLQSRIESLARSNEFLKNIKKED